MKIYSIVITIIACLALAGGVYFFLQYNGMSSAIENCQKAKAGAESQLKDAEDQLSRVGKTNDLLIAALNSFLIPGDLKAITVGSKEAAEVDEAINDIADSKDRMMMEKNWSDFKNSELLVSLFDLLRDTANNIERILAPK